MSIKMNQQERLVVWRALSELFLDTELNNRAYQSIALTIQRSKLSINDTEHILWKEVFPALEKNLNNVAGVWDGWSDDWLLENLQIKEASGKTSGSRANIKMIQGDWSKVLKYLQLFEGGDYEI